MVTPKVLIVDDDPTHLELGREILKLMRADVTCASSGEEALALLTRERFDVIISDLVMSGMSGLDLLREVHNQGADLPVIIVTGYADMDNVEACLHSGAFDYIAKPYDPYLLQATVQRALMDQGSPRPARLAHAPSASSPPPRFPHIIGQSAKMEAVFAKVLKVAESNANVCIYGESGTGKELIARAIHYQSPRKGQPLVTLDCTAIPEGLMESEMFGHAKGAFTSAVTEREGVFQLADKGTLFLDEIGELSPVLQAKLLRVLQCQEFRKVGGTKPIKVDVRIIAATNKDLFRAVQEGHFREDLFYRIEVIPITLPPLRERKEDIPLLVEFFIKKFNQGNKKHIKRVSSHTLDMLRRYSWPGNVRELENCIERAMVMAESELIDVADLSLLIKQASPDHQEMNGTASWTLQEVEKEYILRVLREVQGNRTRAAKLLGISLRGLQYKLKTFNKSA